MNLRQRVGVIGGLGGGVFVQIEQIDNGMLVHYHVPVRLRIPNRPMGLHGGSEEEEAWREGASAFEVDSVERRTVYCKDLAEVNKAVEAAHSAYQEILRTGAGRGDGTCLMGPGSPA